ncbi:hypothetical protein QTP86_016928 [Hemibagrus guttatus]|nr:hypothetical protein QTP86_016928 [Hemibagrus guttatus]
MFYLLGVSSDEIRLDQSPAVVKKPGETVKISCKIHGFCVLEWIKSIYYDGDIYQKDSLKDKFVISRDTSSNTVTLRGQNMQTEDTAVYYCAPHPHNVHGEELTQPASMTVQPGQSLSIHCKVSYSVTSYCTTWIRQPAGKALEWIGRINSGGSVSSDEIRLDQSPAVVKKPGETVKISCKIHGFCVLEWIKSIYYDGDIYQKDSLKDKFVISRDTSSNTVTLRGQNMQTEDTAVYYCAPHPHSDTTSCSQADTKTSSQFTSLIK